MGGIEVDLARHQVMVRVPRWNLHPKEFAFLAALARHPGRVLTHRISYTKCGGRSTNGAQYLRVYASQLRKKIADDPVHPSLVT